MSKRHTSDQDESQDIKDELDGLVKDETIDRVTSMYSKGRGLPGIRSMPDETRVSYPDHMDAVDRVLHVLVNESYREYPLEWIAAAADVPENVCEVILGALVTTGVVTPPHEYGPDGYQLNTYYDVVRETHYKLDQIHTPHELPSDKTERTLKKNSADETETR